MQSGSSTRMSSDSFHWFVIRMTMEPMMVSVQMRMFSGPWCASSVMSNRSFVMRLMSAPVRFLS